MDFIHCDFHLSFYSADVLVGGLILDLLQATTAAVQAFYLKH